MRLRSIRIAVVGLLMLALAAPVWAADIGRQEIAHPPRGSDGGRHLLVLVDRTKHNGRS